MSKGHACGGQYCWRLGLVHITEDGLSVLLKIHLDKDGSLMGIGNVKGADDGQDDGFH